MKKVIGIMLLTLVLLVCPHLVFAAGTVTISVGWVSQDKGSCQLVWDCTSDASGNMSAPTPTWDTPDTNPPIWLWADSRRIDRVIIVPDSGGTAPDPLYDMEARVSSTISTDLLGGLGDNLSQTVTSMDAPLTETNGYPMMVLETPVIYAENMGNANGFTIYILFKK